MYTWVKYALYIYIIEKTWKWKIICRHNIYRPSDKRRAHLKLNYRDDIRSIKQSAILINISLSTCRTAGLRKRALHARSVRIFAYAVIHSRLGIPCVPQNPHASLHGHCYLTENLFSICHVNFGGSIHKRGISCPIGFSLAPKHFHIFCIHSFRPFL